MSKQDLDNWLNVDDDDDDEEEEKKEVKKDAGEKHSAKKWRTGDVFTHRVPTSEDFFAEFGV